MPNNRPACTTAEALRAKAKLIKDQLQKLGLPLRYYLYIGAHRDHLQEIPKVKHEVVGIKVFMGSVQATFSLMMNQRFLKSLR